MDAAFLRKTFALIAKGLVEKEQLLQKEPTRYPYSKALQDEICQGGSLQKLQIVQKNTYTSHIEQFSKTENCSICVFIPYNTAPGHSTTRSICRLCLQRARRGSLAE